MVTVASPNVVAVHLLEFPDTHTIGVRVSLGRPVPPPVQHRVLALLFAQFFSPQTMVRLIGCDEHGDLVAWVRMRNETPQVEMDRAAGSLREILMMSGLIRRPDVEYVRAHTLH